MQGGFYGAYSHDEEERVVRVFGPLVNPGVDLWLPIRTTSPWDPGRPTRGYVEMWGGMVATFPDERASLAPGQSVDWTE